MVACLSSSCYLVLLVGLSFQGRPTVSGASVSIEALQEHGSQHVLNVALAEAAQGLTANDGKEDVLADSNSNYEDPNKGPCLPNEDAVQISGVSGAFCAPECRDGQSCPMYNGFDPINAKPTCCIEVDGKSTPSLCALICNPSLLKGGDCPSGASCKSVQTVGICTYDK